MKQRPTWSEYFFKIAEATAERSTCPRLSVGAVITKDNQIIATGYNGSVSGTEHCEDVGCYMISGSCVRTVHAEQNTILTASKQGISVKGASIYVTHEPCYNCLKYIIQSGINKVYYKESYYSESTDELKQQILKCSDIEMIHIKERTTMNSNFSEKQIEAYATAFCGGDAIWCDGEWREVIEKSSELTTKSPNHYVIRNLFDDVVTDGFSCNVSPPYRVTTLEDYKLQGGEKLVWLGENNSSLTFGKVYEVNSKARYRDDLGHSRIAENSSWGVIPRYNQVTEQQKEHSSETVEQKETNSKPKSETIDIAQILYKRYKNNLKTLLQNDILSALKQEDYLKVAELSKLMAELKKQS